MKKQFFFTIQQPLFLSRVGIQNPKIKILYVSEAKGTDRFSFKSLLLRLKLKSLKVG